MNRKAKLAIAASGAIMSVGMAPQAVAQNASDRAALMSLDIPTLRGEVERRYEAALAASTDATFINASDTRYLWALEAKAQCGIALGFLKSSTKDTASIGNCGRAYDLMMRSRNAAAPPPPPPPSPPPPPPPVAVCADPSPKLIFFDFDSAVPPPSAKDTLDFVIANAANCNWTGLSIVGHTDRSGSDQYNRRLSQQRADAIANVLSSAGVAPSLFEISAQGESEPRVPTADGVRELQNRRVEITIK